MTKLMWFGLIVCACASTGAQSLPAAQQESASGGTIRGRVIDFKTQEPIAKALVSVPVQNKQASTGPDGKFELDGVSPGPVDLYVSTVGYGLLKQRVVIQPGMAELELLIGQEALKHTDHVTVSAGPFSPVQPDASVAYSVTNAELKNLSSVMLDDPVRAVQSLPGVAATNDWYGQFSVRGAGGQDVGVYVNGAVMKNAFHTIPDDRGESASMGLFNNDTVETMELLSGGLPARFGDGAEAALDIHTRHGDAARPSYRADFSLVAASATMEGPLTQSKRLTYLVSARKDYVSLIMGRDSGLGLAFYDVFGDLAYRANESNRFAFTAVHGATGISKSQKGEVGVDRLKDGNSRSDLFSFQWTWTPGHSTVSQAQGYFTPAVARTRDAALDILEHSDYNRAGFREDFTRQLAAWTSLEAGFAIERFSDSFRKNEPWDYVRQQLSPALLQTANFSKDSTQRGAYVQESFWAFAKRLSLTVGGRWDSFAATGQDVFLPRAALSLAVRPRTRLTAAVGESARFPDPVELYGEFGTPFLRAQRTRQALFAVDQLFGEKTRVHVEVYDRERREGIFSPATEFRAASLTGPVLFPQLGPVLSNSLRGYSRGIEVVLQRRSANRLSGWVSYALSYTRYVDAATNLHFWSDFDQRHTVNAYGSCRLSPTINLSGNARYGSNFPVPGYFGSPLISGGLAYFPLVNLRNETRLPAYFRLDARVNKVFYRKRSKTTLYFEMTNLTNHANYRYWGFIPDYVRSQGSIAAGRGQFLPVIPTVGLAIEF